MRQQVRKLLTARLQTGSAMTAFMTAFTCFRLWTHRSPPLTGGLDRIRQQPTPTAEGHNSDGVFGSARIRKLMMLVAAILARAIMIAGFCALGGGAFASPVQYGLNFYEFTSASGITWSNAEAAAEGLSYNGVNGHLATVTSAGENIFLASLISSPLNTFTGAWLGGTAGYAFPTGAPGGWLVGPEADAAFTFTNWNVGEGLATADAGLLYMNIGTTGPNGGGLGKWFDDSGVQGVPSGGDPVKGYFVEFEAVPLPALPLLASGLGGLGLLGWRRKRKADVGGL